jgi:hypothetical protein
LLNQFGAMHEDKDMRILPAMDMRVSHVAEHDCLPAARGELIEHAAVHAEGLPDIDNAALLIIAKLDHFFS